MLMLTRHQFEILVSLISSAANAHTALGQQQWVQRLERASQALVEHAYTDPEVQHGETGRFDEKSWTPVPAVLIDNNRAIREVTDFEQQLMAERDHQQQQISDLKGNLHSANHRALHARDAADRLESDVARLQRALAVAQCEKGRMERDAAALRGRISAMERDHAELQQLFADKDAEIARMKDDVERYLVIRNKSSRAHHAMQEFLRVADPVQFEASLDSIRFPSGEQPR